MFTLARLAAILPGTALSDAMTYQNFIDGSWVSSATGNTFENRNPADTRDLIGVFQQSDRRDVAQAIEAAARAFTRWRLRTRAAPRRNPVPRCPAHRRPEGDRSPAT